MGRGLAARLAIRAGGVRVTVARAEGPGAIDRGERAVPAGLLHVRWSGRIPCGRPCRHTADLLAGRPVGCPELVATVVAGPARTGGERLPVRRKARLVTVRQGVQR